ncbi:MAG: PKD domain-containing protein [Gammaproteobacteria bacterium]
MNTYRKLRRLPAGPRRWLMLLGLAGALVSTSFAAQGYALTDLGVDVTPKDINDLGIVVGTLSTPQGPATAFRWTAGALEKLNGATVANAINYKGQIAGNTPTGAFLFDGQLIDLGDGHSAGDINNNGGIAGSEAGTNPYRASPLPVNPAVYDGQWHSPDIARVFSRGTRKGIYADQYRLAGYNDNGYAVGKKTRVGLVGSSSFMLTPSLDVVFLSVPYGGYAAAINNQHMIVGATGTNSRTGDYQQAYLHDGAGIKLLGTLGGGLTSSAADINEANQVVGTSWLVTRLTSLVEPEKHHAFLWENDVMTDLNDLKIVQSSGWILTAATAINNGGDIVGTGLYDEDGDGQPESHGFLLTASAGGPPPPPPPPATQLPVATASANTLTGPARLRVRFTGAASYDPDGGAIVDYAWDFGDGRTGSGARVRHTYRRAGNYVATLTVTDDEGDSATTQLQITVTK